MKLKCLSKCIKRYFYWRIKFVTTSDIVPGESDLVGQLNTTLIQDCVPSPIV